MTDTNILVEPDTQSNRPWWHYGLAGLIVIVVVILIASLFSEDEDEDETKVVVQPKGVIAAPPPVVPTGTNATILTDPADIQPSAGQTTNAGSATSGQSSGAGAASVGQSFTPPADNVNMNTGTSSTPAVDSSPVVEVSKPTVAPTVVPVAPVAQPIDPLAGIKFIRLYSEPEFKGSTKLLLPGTTTSLIEKKGSTWEWKWKSMRVTPQALISFSRYSGGGRTSRAFAKGLFDVSDFSGWFNSVPALSSDYNIDTGMALERSWSGGSNTVNIAVDTESSWKDKMNKSYQGCLSTIKSWSKQSPGKYTNEYCANAAPDALNQTFTISL